MEVVKTNPMIVNCSHCRSTCVSYDVKDFREISNTYPPTFVFVCPSCKQDSKIKGNIPERLVAHMSKKIYKELGICDNYMYNNGSLIEED